MQYLTHILILFNVLNNIKLHALVTPTTSNSTSEYYWVTNVDNIIQPSFICNSNLCFIDCFGQNACKDGTIDASSSQNLILNCRGDQACSGIYLSPGPTVSADINCVWGAGRSCSQATFTLTTTNTINLECSQDTKSSSSSGSCYDVTLYTQQAGNVNINCQGDYDCYQFNLNPNQASVTTTSTTFNANGAYSLSYGVIKATDSSYLEINCNAGSACRYMDVFPPYENNEYTFRLYCIPIAYSCQYVDITVSRSDNIVPNYMELLCPRKEISYTCDIDFKCLDISTSVSTSISFSSSDARYECSNNKCCPWEYPDNMMQSTTTEVALPGSISPTRSNATGEWYILDDQVTGRLISCSNSNGCYISCETVSSCTSAIIYAGITSYLSLTCSGNTACPNVYITEGPLNQADIYCNSRFGNACGSSVFVMENTEIINLYCDSTGTVTSSSSGNCNNAVLLADNSQYVSIICESDYDCYSTDFHIEDVSVIATIIGNGDYSNSYGNIYAVNANRLELYCNGGNSCRYINVYPPYDDEYKFKLFCNSKIGSCQYFDIKIPSSSTFSNNYMELICPQAEIIYSCDIDWYCLDVSTSSLTRADYNDYYGLWQCYSSQLNCCPWKESNTRSNIIKSNRTILSNSILPTSTDSNGEYYTLDSETSEISISCTDPNGCYITCSVAKACYQATIYAGDTNYLELICSNQNSCYGIYMTDGPKIEANIDCTSVYSSTCAYSDFIFSNTETVNLKCDRTGSSSSSSSAGSCNYLTLRAEKVNIVNIHCEYDYDCYNAGFYLNGITEKATVVAKGEYALGYTNIYATYATKLNVTCDATSACRYMNVHPPYFSTYDFDMTCSSYTGACQYVDIYTANKSIYHTNYMSLRCPIVGDTQISYQCDIDFNCEDNSMSSITYSSTNERYECNDLDCCPWEDADYMIAPRECVVIDGKFCGSSLFVRGFNIFTLTTSGNSILNSNKLIENTEIWSDEGASCSLSSLEFTSSYSSYSTYAEADSLSIDGSYSTDTAGAGGSLSQTRSKIKSFAATSQSYIYSLSVDCQTAQASVVAYNKIYWNSNFINSLRLLPTSYIAGDLSEFTNFWDTYGTHLIKNAKLGGTIRGAVVASTCSVLDDYGESSSYEVCLNAEYKGAVGEGCYGEVEDIKDIKTAYSAIGIKQISVKGGDTSEFTSIFNQFGSKNNDFQSWINDLAVFPDIVGGNLVEIYSVIKGAISLGNHRLNDDLDTPIDNSVWLSIANAMEDAYNAYKTQLTTDDHTIDDCAITCHEGTVDALTCSCSSCNDISGCCGLSDTDDAYSLKLNYVSYFCIIGFFYAAVILLF